MPDLNQVKGEESSAFVYDKDLYNKSTQPIPIPQVQIGVDLDNSFYQNIIRQGESGHIDLSTFDEFFRAARSRDEIYSLIDVMGEDSTVSAILETYAEDATEYNEDGHIIWAESGNADVDKYVNYLLDSMNVDKYAYKWIHSLAKYGDVYLRLYRQSDYEDDLLLNEEEEAEEGSEEAEINKRILIEDLNNNSEKEPLNEDVKINAYDKKDHYIHFIGMVPNPAEMFDLIKFDKSYAFIQADINSLNASRKTGTTVNSFYHYDFKKNDINIYQPTTFVHACLEENSSRTPEEVTIFKDDKSYNDSKDGISYNVRRGQSLLYSTFKIWRELSLLENVVMLNRVTKSAVVRVINVEVGDMPKEMVQPHLQGIKTLFEQKANIEAGKSFGEYTNPGPVENTVYVPTRGGIGNLSTQQIGGEVDIGKLSDLDYFQDKFFGAMRVPKQFFGITDDNAGFSGGQSLSIISSRYAKMVKRLQNTLIQALTDAVNMMLLDKGLKSYIHKFTIKMTPPVTQEEIDRREATSNKVGLARDVMDLLNNDITDPVLKLQALKELLASVAPGTDITNIIQQEIDRLEKENKEAENPSPEENNEETDIDADINLNLSSEGGIDAALGLDEEPVEETSEENEEESALPSPADLSADIDFTDNNSPEFNG